jgi:hypothetical protein
MHSTRCGNTRSSYRAHEKRPAQETFMLVRDCTKTIRGLWTFTSYNEVQGNNFRRLCCDYDTRRIIKPVTYVNPKTKRHGFCIGTQLHSCVVIVQVMTNKYPISEISSSHGGEYDVQNPITFTAYRLRWVTSEKLKQKLSHYMPRRRLGGRGSTAPTHSCPRH